MWVLTEDGNEMINLDHVSGIRLVAVTNGDHGISAEVRALVNVGVSVNEVVLHRETAVTRIEARAMISDVYTAIINETGARTLTELASPLD